MAGDLAKLRSIWPHVVSEIEVDGNPETSGPQKAMQEPNLDAQSHIVSYILRGRVYRHIRHKVMKDTSRGWQEATSA